MSKIIVERLPDRTIVRYHKKNGMESIVIYFLNRPDRPDQPFVWKDYRKISFKEWSELNNEIRG